MPSPEPTPYALPPQRGSPGRDWRAAAALGCALLLMGALGLGIARALFEAPYPRAKRAAFAQLRAMGPEALVAQGRTVIQAGHTAGPVPPTIAALHPAEVTLQRADPGRPPSLWIRLGGGGLDGPWGFMVVAEGEDYPQSPGFVEVVNGLYFAEADDAPTRQRGLPAGW